jgi:hypothetical protein
MEDLNEQNTELMRGSSPDSLFDDPDDEHIHGPIVQLLAPSIRGLYYSPSILLPPELCTTLFTQCTSAFFSSSLTSANQVMLFGTRMLPSFLVSLLQTLAHLLRPLLPAAVHTTLFDSSPERRQAIVNRYEPGDGISPHVDLLGRYADGIVGVSLGSSCSMVFARGEEKHAVFLPPGSAIVLTGEARYDWTHGIERRFEDLVQGEEGDMQVKKRETRISITFRWLLPDAMVVGGP